MMRAMAATILIGLAITPIACGGDDEDSPATETETVTMQEEATDSGVPADGPVDALELLSAAGAAGDEFDNAFIENGILVLTLRGDPSAVDPKEIVDACDAMREATGAIGVETETPDRVRTKVC